MTRAERKAAGLCNDCNSPAVAGLVRCARHREMAALLRLTGSGCIHGRPLATGGVCELPKPSPRCAHQ
jgi:hypothetical protein